MTVMWSQQSTLGSLLLGRKSEKFTTATQETEEKENIVILSANNKCSLAYSVLSSEDDRNTECNVIKSAILSVLER